MPPRIFRRALGGGISARPAITQTRRETRIDPLRSPDMQQLMQKNGQKYQDD